MALCTDGSLPYNFNLALTPLSPSKETGMATTVQIIEYSDYL